MASEPGEVVGTLVAEWLRRARADMSVALLTEDERIAPEIIAFHAQQAVEKLLKALLVLRQMDFPHTHAIGALLTLCETAGFSDTQDVIEASSLTRYAVAARYPGEDEPVSRQEAREASTLAGRVVAWGLAQIPADVKER